MSGKKSHLVGEHDLQNATVQGLTEEQGRTSCRQSGFILMHKPNELLHDFSLTSSSKKTTEKPALFALSPLSSYTYGGLGSDPWTTGERSRYIISAWWLSGKIPSLNSVPGSSGTTYKITRKAITRPLCLLSHISSSFPQLKEDIFIFASSSKDFSSWPLQWAHSGYPRKSIKCLL